MNLVCLLFMLLSSSLKANFLSEQLFSFYLDSSMNRFFNNVNKSKYLESFCKKVCSLYERFSWGHCPCKQIPWSIYTLSKGSEPLIFYVFDGRSRALRPHTELSCRLEDESTSLILGGVHPDELNPVYVAFKFAQTLFTNPNLYQGLRVIVAPLVNPDGFMKSPPTRTNLNGIDLNRNFPTQDWMREALKVWKQGFSNKRRFPGKKANSETETKFQIMLINNFHPNKIISIHAPLDFLDLDFSSGFFYPGDVQVQKFLKIGYLTRMISKSSGFHKVRNFRVYSGSLGKYAGKERAIPTYTLELSSSDPKRAHKFWKDFSPGLFSAIRYKIKSYTLKKESSSPNIRASFNYFKE